MARGVARVESRTVLDRTVVRDGARAAADFEVVVLEVLDQACTIKRDRGVRAVDLYAVGAGGGVLTIDGDARPGDGPCTEICEPRAGDSRAVDRRVVDGHGDRAGSAAHRIDADRAAIELKIAEIGGHRRGVGLFDVDAGHRRIGVSDLEAGDRDVRGVDDANRIGAGAAGDRAGIASSRVGGVTDHDCADR